MTPRTEKIILFLLFLLNFILHFSLISKGPYHPDCFLLALKSQESLKSHQIHYLQGTGLPLTVLLGALFVGIFKIASINDPVFAVNFMSVTLSSLSIPILFLLIKNLLDPKTALITSLLFTFNPIFSSLSSFGNSHIPALLFFLTALLFLTKKPRTSQSLFLSCFFIALMGASRPQDLFPLSLVFIYVFLYEVRSAPILNTQKKIIHKQLPRLFRYSLLTAAILLVFYLPALTTHSQMTENPLVALKNNLFDPIKYYSLISLRNFFFFLIPTNNLFTFAIFSIGAYQIFKRNSRVSIVLFLWFIVPLLSFGGLGICRPRYFLIASIPIAICIGHFASCFYKKNKLLNGCAIGIIGFLALTCFLTTTYPVLSFRHKHTPTIDFYRWIGQVTEKNASIINNTSIFVKHISQRNAIGFPFYTYELKNESFRAFKASIDKLTEQNIPLYITSTVMAAEDLDKSYNDYLIDNFHFQLIGEKIIDAWRAGSTRLHLKRIGLYKMTKIKK